MPGVDVWERVDVATGLMPIDVSAPGMAVTLTPRRPGASSLRSIELFGSPPSFNAGSATDTPPTITRLELRRARQPLPERPARRPKLGALVSATWIRSSYSERDSTGRARPAASASAFVNVTTTPTPGDEVRVIGWGQRTRDAVAAPRRCSTT